MALESQPSEPGQTVLITGASGLIGRALGAQLVKNRWQVIGLSRNPAAHKNEYPSVHWISSLNTLNTPVDVVVNLAGASIGSKRWTDQRKKELRDSRIALTQDLFGYFKQQATLPKTVISASAVGIYGPRDATPVDENTGPGSAGFGVALCKDWEEAANAFTGLGARVVNTRFGVVLARQAPAWQQLSASLMAKCATYLGSGDQMFSWITLEDAVRALMFVIQTPACQGPFNVTAPAPLSQKAMAETLKNNGKAWFCMGVPAPVMKGIYGEMAEEILLSGQAAVPKNLMESGFTFHYPDFAKALDFLI